MGGNTFMLQFFISFHVTQGAEVCLYYQEIQRGRREPWKTLMLGIFYYIPKNKRDMKRSALNQRLSYAVPTVLATEQIAELEFCFFNVLKNVNSKARRVCLKRRDTACNCYVLGVQYFSQNC
jgi:hypothetical protein